MWKVEIDEGYDLCIVKMSYLFSIGKSKWADPSSILGIVTAACFKNLLPQLQKRVRANHEYLHTKQWILKHAEATRSRMEETSPLRIPHRMMPRILLLEKARYKGCN